MNDKKDKIISFFKSRGYIFIVLICLAAIIAAGVSIINLDNDKPNGPVIAYNTPISGISTTPASPTLKPSHGQSEKPTATQPQSTDVSRPIVDNTAKPDETVFIKPLEGKIQTEFAANKLVYNSTMQEWRTHAGIDIESSVGSPVKAVANGKISAIKSDPRYGLTVVIDHNIGGKNFSSIYCGLANTSDKLALGGDVKSGDTIGSLGEDIFCERAQGAHLHFELTENNLPVNPAEYWK